MLAHRLNNLSRGQAVRQQSIVRMVQSEPFHDLIRLGMKHELPSLQSDHRSGRDAFAAYYPLDVLQGQMLHRLFPYRAVLAF